jgi:hypothetical protein
MDKTLALQLQIRNNAEEVSSALSEIQKWEKKMKDKDSKLKSKKVSIGEKIRSVSTRAGGTVPIRTELKHRSITYTLPNLLPPKPAPVTPLATATPATIVQGFIPETTTSNVPRALGQFAYIDSEETERERGNTEFKAGNFTAAVKCYTKCLGLKVIIFI